MATGCHLWFSTGFRPRATVAELDWLNSFVPIAAIDTEPHTAATTGFSRAPERELEFVRERIAGVEHLGGRVGTSAGGEAMIFCRRELYLIPMARVVRFHVERTLPAQGGGGSVLTVECSTDDGGPTLKRLTIAAGRGPDDLNLLAMTLAKATGRPYELEAYCYDV